MLSMKYDRMHCARIALADSLSFRLLAESKGGLLGARWSSSWPFYCTHVGRRSEIKFDALHSWRTDEYRFWDTKDISNWGSREIPTQLQHSQMMEFLLENSANDGLTYCYAAIYLINLLNRFTFLWIVSIVSSVKSICASEINQRESTWIILQKIKGKKKHSMIEVGATFLR